MKNIIVKSCWYGDIELAIEGVCIKGMFVSGGLNWAGENVKAFSPEDMQSKLCTEITIEL